MPRYTDSIAAGNTLVAGVETPITHEITLHDETLRDGEQTIGVAFSPEQKVEIVVRLLDAGIRSLNIGFPAVSADEREGVKAIVQRVGSGFVSCLSRAEAEDIKTVIACGVSNVALFIAISDIHLQRKLRLSEDQAHAKMVEQIRFANSHGLTVRFALEDATRAPLERIKRFACGAREAGASVVNLCDTCGVLTPNTAFHLVSEIRKAVGSDAVAVHFHNDLGLALANSLAACAAGARYVQGTLMGLGERAGNTSLEQLSVALRVKYGLHLGLDLVKLMGVARWVGELVRWPLLPSQPCLGDNVFAHESGVHVHGIMQDLACYEPYPPEMVGRRHEVRYGKHSGLSNLRYLLNERARDLGLSESALARVLATVKQLGARACPPTPDEVLALLEGAAEGPDSTG